MEGDLRTSFWEDFTFKLEITPFVKTDFHEKSTKQIYCHEIENVRYLEI